VATYILTWNPERWAFEDWPQALTDLREQGFYVRQWSCVSRGREGGLRFTVGHGTPKSPRQ